jgi:hypothetical protein
MALDIAKRVVDAGGHADHLAVKKAADEVGGDHVAAEAARQDANSAVQIAFADAGLVISILEAMEAAENAVRATAGAANEDAVWLGAYYGIADGPLPAGALAGPAWSSMLLPFSTTQRSVGSSTSGCR